MTLAALTCGFYTLVSPEKAALAGSIFLIISAFNLLVLSFEFGRASSLSFALGALALIVCLIFLNQQYGFIEPLQNWLKQRNFSAEPEFYFAIGGIQLLMLVGMFVSTRFDYWQLSGNELIHKTGFLGDIERFSTAGLKLNKEITDVFEYLIGGGGRIILVIPGNSRPIVLENVLGIRKIEKFANQVLDARVVRLEKQASSSDHGEGVG